MRQSGVYVKKEFQKWFLNERLYKKLSRRNLWAKAIIGEAKNNKKEYVKQAVYSHSLIRIILMDSRVVTWPSEQCTW